MKQLVAAFFLLVAGGTLAAQTQPKIAAGGVLNSGSYAPPGLPNAAIAQGSLFVVKGANLGPVALQQVTAYPLATSLGGTSLTVIVNGTTTRPLLFYTSAGQVAAILPSATPVGTGTIAITYNGQTSATVPIQVTSSSFGIYTAPASGSGPGLITNQSFQLGSSTAAANPGEAFIIFGTGAGPATGDETGPGSGLKLGTIPVEVLVGGKSATVYGYARAPQFSGLDQIAFAIPAGVTGCSVPVAVKIGNVISNYVSLPIAASGRTCSDATGALPVPITGNGAVSFGNVDLSRSTSSFALPGQPANTSTSEEGSGNFARYNYADYTSYVNPFQIATYGACTVYSFTGSTPTVTNTPVAVQLDAGPQLTVVGPNGTKTLAKSNGLYDAMLGGSDYLLSATSSLYLTKGTYTVTGPGGADVGSFTATLNIPDPLVWTNAAASTTVNRAAGQPITWSGGDPSGTTIIFGYSAAAGDFSAGLGAGFVCLERTSAGQFTIPAAVLLSLPVTSAGGALSVGSTVSAAFTAKGVDQGTISSTSSTLQLATFQ